MFILCTHQPLVGKGPLITKVHPHPTCKYHNMHRVQWARDIQTRITCTITIYFILDIKLLEYF